MAPLLAAAIGANNTEKNSVACKLHPNRHGHAGVCALCLRYRLCVVSVHDQTRNLPDSDSDSDSGVDEDARLAKKAELWRGDNLFRYNTTTKNNNQDCANQAPLRRFSSASEADRHRQGGALMPLLYPLPEPGRCSDATTSVPYWAGKRASHQCGNSGLVKLLPPTSGGRNSGGGRRVSDLHQPRSGGSKEATKLPWVSLFLLRFRHRHRHTTKEEVEKEKVEKEEKGDKSHLHFSELARPSFAEIDRNNYELCPQAPLDRIGINSPAQESVRTRHSRSHSQSHSSQRNRSVGLRSLWRSHSTRHCSDNLRHNPGPSANYLANPSNSTSLDLTNPTESSSAGVNLQNPNNTSSPAGVKLPNPKSSSSVSANYTPNSDYPSPAGAIYLPNPNISSLVGVNLPSPKCPSLAVASLPSPKNPSLATVNLPNPNCSSSALINLANPNYSSLAGVNLPNRKNPSLAGVNLSNPNYSSTAAVNIPNPNYSSSVGANIPNPNNPSLSGINLSNSNNPSSTGASLPNRNCSSAVVNPPNPDYTFLAGVNLQNPNNPSLSLLSSIRSRDYSAFNFYFSPLRNSRRRSCSPTKLNDPKGD